MYYRRWAALEETAGLQDRRTARPILCPALPFCSTSSPEKAVIYLALFRK